MNELSIFSVKNVEFKVIKLDDDNGFLFRFTVSSTDGNMQLNLFASKAVGFFKQLKERIKVLPDSEEKRALEKLIEEH